MRANRGLWVQMSVYTVALAGISVLAVGLAVLAGVERFSVEQQRTDLVVHRKTLADALDARYSAATRVVSSVAFGRSHPLHQPNAESRSLSRTLAGNADLFDALVVICPDEAPIVAVLPGVDPVRPPTLLRVAVGSHGAKVLPIPGEKGGLRPWSVAAEPLEQGGRLIVLGRLRPDIVSGAVEDLSSQRDHRIALVLDSSGELVATPAFVGRSSFRSGLLDEGADGHAVLEDPVFGSMLATWADHDVAEGLTWRLVVAEPKDEVFRRFAGALLPGAGVLILMLGLVVYTVASFGHLVGLPIVRLEGMARRSAEGEYVGPLEVEREDEVGRLTASFNAMAQRLNVLHDVTALLRAASHVEDVVGGIFSATHHILGTADVALFVGDEAAGRLELLKGSGECDMEACTMRLDEGSFVSSAFLAGRPTVFADSDQASESEQLLRRHGIESALAVPLVAPSGAIGVLVVGSKERRDFHEAEVDMVRTFSTQAAIALENARLAEETQRRATRLERIFRISRAVSSSLDPEVVLHRVLDVVQGLFEAEAVALMTSSDPRSTLEVAMARGVSDTRMLHMKVTPGEGLLGEVFESRSPLRVGDLSEREGLVASLAVDQGLRSLLAVPLLARGRAIGLLAVFSEATDAHTSDDMELLLTFASQAAIAIDTATLYRREHHVATVLQSSIIPDELPHVDGLDSASVCLPVATDADIGGDYVDLFLGREGSIVVAIGDVCGKGVEAATKTSMMKYFLRGLAAAGLGPAECLTELNKAVTERGEVGDVVTMWVGELDLGTGVLRWADGGHPPALVRRASSGEVDPLGPTGPLLGAFASAEYGEDQTVLHRGDTLLLYTDGITEARGERGLFGEEGVRDVLAEDGDAALLTSRLLGAVHHFSDGRRLRDDAAILAVRLLPETDALSA